MPGIEPECNFSGNLKGGGDGKVKSGLIHAANNKLLTSSSSVNEGDYLREP